MPKKASPQVENGYIRIANELFVAIMQAKFAASERRCIDLVLRLSYGCGKKSAQFRFWSDFEVAGILKQNVKSVVGDLESKSIFKVDWDTKEISLNKNYLKWGVEMANSGRKLDRLLAINLKKSNPQITNGHTKSNPHITFQGNDKSKSNPHITQKVIPTLPKSNPRITSTASKATDTNGSQPPKDSKDSSKETTTTEAKPSQVVGSSSEDASQLETEAPEGMSNDITILKGEILAKKWPSVTIEPSYTACRRLIEEAGGDVNVVVEAIGRMSLTLKYEQNGDGVVGAIMSYVKNKHYGKSKEEPTTKTPPTLQQRLDEAYANLDYYQKQVDADPRNATDELCIETLAQMHETIRELKEMQDAE